MATKSIKIKVGNRVYPLSVEENEEDRVQQAAQKVNENIQHLRENYAVNDWIDLLAMTAFEFANQSLDGATASVSAAEGLDPDSIKKLEKMEQKIEEMLNFK